ncbi:hypothetical protein pipiens_015320 [Culex pipiens pipiens]|uniref:Uncharacterized protein n=1 Tax=Culex pipiens pipiens TaxID=38569 RepID=A0ABD1CR57_CULPP
MDRYSAKNSPIYWLAENGLHVNSHRLFVGSTSPEGFPTRQERPRSCILDRHAILKLRCETIAHTHAHTAQQTQDRLRAYRPRTTHPVIQLAVRQEPEDNLEEAHEKGDAK